MSTKRIYNRSDIAFIVGQYHVSTPVDTILRNIEGRTKGWPAAQRRMALRDARRAHSVNRDLYFSVMKGMV